MIQLTNIFMIGDKQGLTDVFRKDDRSTLASLETRGVALIVSLIFVFLDINYGRGIGSLVLGL